MTQLVRPFRVVVIFLVLAVLLVLYGSSLYRLQLTKAAPAPTTAETPADTGKAETPAATFTQTRTAAAARGRIFDRNGTLLAGSRIVYNVTLSRSALVRSGASNRNLRELIRTARDFNVEYEDRFPVTIGTPYAFEEMTAIQRSRLDTYLEYAGLSQDVSAPELMRWLYAHYGLDEEEDFTEREKRLVAGVRYELEVRFADSAIPAYAFAEDVDPAFVAELTARNVAGVVVNTDSERVYYTDAAAHLIGYLGSMTKEEYEKYSQLGYNMDELVGKTGAEQAFESWLHSRNGTVLVTTDENGAVISEEIVSEPIYGSDVYLSCDLSLQMVAETALSELIASINAERTEAGEELATGGAAVVLDVNTGAALAMANWPTYNVATFYQDYAALSQDPNAPLHNRTTTGQYNPGSTFKLVTAYAALKEDVITTKTLIEDTGVYRKYESYQPRCWYYPKSHGKLNVFGAIAQSCNVFFYTVGDQLGIAHIAETAELFGLGVKTGIEIGESAGTIASPESKRERMKEGWYPADTLLACIGQSLNLFTPVQIADYTATIANGGTRYAVTVLDHVTDDQGNLLLQQEPRVMWVIDDAQNGLIPVLQQGMEAVVEYGTAASRFKDFGIPVAAKTGTTQATDSKNSAVFICYAPSDDPQIAIAIVVEKGGSGSSIIGTAQTIMDYYFGGIGFVRTEPEEEEAPGTLEEEVLPPDTDTGRAG